MSTVCRPGARPVAEALVLSLISRGVRRLGIRVPFSPQKVQELGPQYLAVEMLVREYIVAESMSRGRLLFSCEGLDIIGGRGPQEAPYSISRKGHPVLSWSDLLSMVPDPPIPLIAIDLGMIGIHTEEERNSLRVQLAMSLSTVRRFLWDRHLALTSAPEGLDKWLYPVMGRHKAILTRAKPGEVFWRMKVDRVIILRPDAEERLSGADVLEAEGFLVGGIVDKLPRPGISRFLDTLVPWGEPRRIELRGSTIGVPARINRVVEILLKARYDYMGDLEAAIVSSMSRSDRVNRIFYELAKKRLRRARLCDLLEEYSWLGATREDILLAARRARVEILESGGCQ